MPDKISPRTISRFAVETIESAARLRKRLRIHDEEVRLAVRVMRRYARYLKKEEPWATSSIRILTDAIEEVHGLVPDDDEEWLSKITRRP